MILDEFPLPCLALIVHVHFGSSTYVEVEIMISKQSGCFLFVCFLFVFCCACLVREYVLVRACPVREYVLAIFQLEIETSHPLCAHFWSIRAFFVSFHTYLHEKGNLSSVPTGVQLPSFPSVWTSRPIL